MDTIKVIPKGKAKKLAKKQNYRTDLYSIVRKYFYGTGVARLIIEDFGDVQVNSMVVKDLNYEIKPEDVVSINAYWIMGNGYEKKRVIKIISAEDIERTW